MNPAAINEAYVGVPGSRQRLHTPALVLDLDALEHNIAEMTRRAARHRIALRPHAKTHKSADIARLQLAAGAIGICTAKLGEAVALRREGIADIHITSPIVTAEKLAIAAQLAAQQPGLSIVADRSDLVPVMANAARAAGTTLDVLVDLGMGANRTGVATPQDAGSLALLIAQTEGLRFRGLQAYAGHLQHIENEAERRAAAQADQTRISEAIAAIKQQGLDCDIVTGAGTGTHDVDGESGVFTELQVGSYVFMDVEYLRVAPLNTSGFKTALTVQTTVINANVANQVTTDAGFKCFAMDGPLPEIAAGAPAGLEYFFQGDEHGGLKYANDAPVNLPVGTVLNITTPHCDPTVNLYDWYHCVRGDTLVALWRVHGRGMSW